MSDRDRFGAGGGTMPPPSTEYPAGSGAGSSKSEAKSSLIIAPDTGTARGGQGASSSDTAKEQAGQAADQAKQKAGQAKEKASQAADQAKEKAGQAADQAKEKVGQAAEQASAKADEGIDKAAGGLGQAADMLRDKTQGLESQGGAGATAQNLAGTAATQLDKAARYLEGKDTDTLVGDLESLVRRKPTESLLVAAGVGLLLSRIVR